MMISSIVKYILNKKDPSIQHCIEGYSHSNYARKLYKRHLDWKGSNKTIYTDDMILYMCLEN